jgi:hypothetical protein
MRIVKGLDGGPRKLDQDARYRVRGWRGGIVFRIAGFPDRWEPVLALVTDPETGDDREELIGDVERVEQDETCGRVLVVMVGDDRVYEVDVEDLEPLEAGAFCSSCGQVGCRATVV